MSNMQRFLEKNDLDKHVTIDQEELIKLLGDYSSMDNQALSEKLEEEEQRKLFKGRRVDLYATSGTLINTIRDIVKSQRVTNNYISDHKFWLAGLVVGVWGLLIIQSLQLIFK